MSIYYLNEHTVCSNYISDFTIGFSFYHIAEGDFFIPSNKKYNCLFFLINGSANLFYDSGIYKLSTDSIAFIPMTSEFKMQALTDVTIVINYFNKPIDLCEKLALESLVSYIEPKYENTILKLNRPLKRFIVTLIDYLNEGISCKHFHEIKEKELFFILRFFYSKKEIASLFAPIISRDLDFKSMVLNNYLDVNSVKELAQSCNYSLSSFNRVFKENFNENPYVWLQNQKLKHIVGKLQNKNVPFSEIIDEFGFSSPGHFTIFCKKHLNQTPTQYRRQNSK